MLAARAAASLLVSIASLTGRTLVLDAAAS